MERLKAPRNPDSPLQESSMALRLWTAGWDFYAPTKAESGAGAARGIDHLVSYGFLWVFLGFSCFFFNGLMALAVSCFSR